MRVTWSPEALDDVARIYDYIAAFTSTAVQDMARRLFEADGGLLILPHRGRPLPDGRRELIIVRPYIIVHRVWGAEVRILAVWYGALLRDWAAEEKADNPYAVSWASRLVMPPPFRDALQAQRERP